MPTVIIRLSALISIVAYVSILDLPAWHCGDTVRDGHYVLENGWTGLIAFEPRWLSNPIYFALLARCLLGATHRSTVATTAAIAMVVLVFFSLVESAPGCTDMRPRGPLAAGAYAWAAILFLTGALVLIQEARLPREARADAR